MTDSPELAAIRARIKAGWPKDDSVYADRASLLRMLDKARARIRALEAERHAIAADLADARLIAKEQNDSAIAADLADARLIAKEQNDSAIAANFRCVHLKEHIEALELLRDRLRKERDEAQAENERMRAALHGIATNTLKQGSTDERRNEGIKIGLAMAADMASRALQPTNKTDSAKP
jgi:hypothetical protein